MTTIALYVIQWGRAMHMKYVSASQKQCTLGHEEHPGHRQGASRDVGDVRLAERRTEEGTDGAHSASLRAQRRPSSANRSSTSPRTPGTKSCHQSEPPRDSLLRNKTLLF